MGGIIGRLFREFAVTIGVAILVSGFVSLSLTPMLCSRFLKPHARGEARPLLPLRPSAASTRCSALYARTLGPALRHPRQGARLLGRSSSSATGCLFVKIPKGFLPTRGQGPGLRLTEGAQGIGFPAMREHQQAGRRDRPQRTRTSPTSISSCGPRGNISVGNSGIVLAQLKPRSAAQALGRRDHRGAAAEAREDPGDPGLPPDAAADPPRRKPDQEPVPVHAAGLGHGGALPVRADPRAEDARALRDPGRDERPAALQPAGQRRRSTATRRPPLGITPQKIEDALYTAYGSRQISTIYAPNNEYQVIMELAPEFQADPAAIALLYVRSSAGQLVPLSSLGVDHAGHRARSPSPTTGQLPSVTLSFNLKPGRLARRRRRPRSTGVARQTLPATDPDAASRARRRRSRAPSRGWASCSSSRSSSSTWCSGSSTRASSIPLTILSALPFAGFGALVTLMLFRTELSIYAFVGIIMLVGLVKKNGIMMVDFAIEAQRGEGKSAADGDLRGLPRPVPADHDDDDGRADGHAARSPWASARAPSRAGRWASPSSAACSSRRLLTLYVTPVFYIFMDRLRQRLERRRGKDRGPARRRWRPGGRRRPKKGLRRPPGCASRRRSPPRLSYPLPFSQTFFGRPHGCEHHRTRPGCNRPSTHGRDPADLDHSPYADTVHRRRTPDARPPGPAHA